MFRAKLLDELGSIYGAIGSSHLHKRSLTGVGETNGAVGVRHRCSSKEGALSNGDGKCADGRCTFSLLHLRSDDERPEDARALVDQVCDRRSCRSVGRVCLSLCAEVACLIVVFVLV